MKQSTEREGRWAQSHIERCTYKKQSCSYGVGAVSETSFRYSVSPASKGKHCKWLLLPHFQGQKQELSSLISTEWIKAN
jgi:hypothetical protein